MSKYNIEGNIDFYSELYKSLDTEDDVNNDENICLITNQPLTSFFVKMDCGHKFNYIPIYNDLVNHKQKFNNLEGDGKLNYNEIRCPYCRNKQIGLLPYHEELQLKKIPGVNYIHPDKEKYNQNYIRCDFLLENIYFNNDMPEAEANIKNKGNVKYYLCSHSGTQISGENYGDEKCYCFFHKKQILTKHKKEYILKQKQESKQKKIKEKEEAKQLKEELKQKVKDEKQKTKEESKQKKPKKVNDEILGVENVILGPSNICVGCKSILKTGANKGNMCNLKIFENDLCKRHYNNKISIIKDE